jgi:hypothetical protein
MKYSYAIFQKIELDKLQKQVYNGSEQMFFLRCLEGDYWSVIAGQYGQVIQPSDRKSLLRRL